MSSPPEPPQPVILSNQMSSSPPKPAVLSNNEPSTPVPSKPSKPSKSSKSSKACTLQHTCLLCTLEPPPSITVKNPTWPAIMKVVLYCLYKDTPSKRYFALKTDIYPFIDSHWDTLCSGKSEKWHKPMQDALSHGLSLFKSGRGRHGTGFWGLKTHSDPWKCSENGSEIIAENESGSLIFPPSQSAGKGKRKLDELYENELQELMSEARSIDKEFTNMGTTLKGMKTEFEAYKLSTAIRATAFNAERESVQAEMMQLLQYSQQASPPSSPTSKRNSDNDEGGAIHHL